jgi:hypothetical protein
LREINVISEATNRLTQQSRFKFFIADGLHFSTVNAVTIKACFLKEKFSFACGSLGFQSFP